MSLKSDRKTFARPPESFGPRIVWRWNDALDEAALVAQLNAFADGGIGHVLIRASEGLPRDAYLSDAWFEALAAVLKRAKKRSVSVWLHAEYAWPATGAGTRAPLEYGATFLEPVRFTIAREHVGPDFASEYVAAFMSDATGWEFPAPRYFPILFDTRAEDFIGTKVLAFRAGRDARSFNCLNSEAAAHFIDATFERYSKRLKRMLATVSGFYVTGISLPSDTGRIAWDPDLPVFFRETRGYDLLPYLPSLLVETPDHRRVRSDYWALVAEMLREGAVLPLRTWCARHKVGFAVESCGDRVLVDTIRETGAPIVEHGGGTTVCIEISGASPAVFRARQGRRVNVKEAASALNQLGGGGPLASLYRHGGPRVSVEQTFRDSVECSMLGAAGVVWDGAPHSLRGDRKIENVPAIGPHQPHWKFSGGLIEAAARASWLLSRGYRACPVLLLHPLSSLQATTGAMSDKEVVGGMSVPELLARHFALLSAALLREQFDHDYGDEGILTKHAFAEGRTLRVGKVCYGAVVVPPSVDIKSDTLQVLQDFATGGGRIACVGSAPILVDGSAATAARDFFDEYAVRLIDGIDHFEYGAVIGQLRAWGLASVKVVTDPPELAETILVTERAWEDRRIVAVLNTGETTIEARIECTGVSACVAERWDVASGAMTPEWWLNADEVFTATRTLVPGVPEIHVFIPAKTPVNVPVARTFRETHQIALDWRGRRAAANVLRLDCCRIDETGAPMTVASAREYLYKRIRRAKGPVWLRSEWPFEISPIIPWTEACQAVIELPKDAGVFLNGEELYLNVKERVLDRCMMPVNLPRLLLGTNTLAIEGEYNDAWAFESPWVRGEFRVATDDNARFVMEFDSGPIAVGAWPEHGMPFYFGSVLYVAETEAEAFRPGERVMLNMSGLVGAASVRVNGSAAGEIWRRPYRCELTKWWKRGRVLLEIEVANTLRNFLGPHFAQGGRNQTSFTRSDYEGALGAPRSFEACGLLGSPFVSIESDS